MIRELAVKELPGFVESNEYKLLNPKPITPERALSQFYNPRAKPDDIALIYCAEKTELLGFVGLLPDYINGNHDITASSNSGWWVHPVKGRNIGLQLFARALKCCRSRLFFTDCTAHSKNILQRTGWFHFAEPQKGHKFIFRFYLKLWLKNKNANCWLIGLGAVTDTILNVFLELWYKAAGLKTYSPGYIITRIAEPDNEIATFIKLHNRNEFTARSAEEINWILNNKWLTQNSSLPEVAYPFSRKTGSFSQQVFGVKLKEKMVGVFFVNIRDGHAAVPYLYIDDAHTFEALSNVVNYLINQKVYTLTVYNPVWAAVVKKRKIPSIFTKVMVRNTGVSIELITLFNQFPVVQDGDGDVVFT